MPYSIDVDVSLPPDATNVRNYTLAVSGDVFRWVIEYANEEIIKRVSLISHGSVT